jgi:hypothetical protein
MLELNPGPAGAAITEIARVRDRVLFGAEDGVHGVELFTLSLGEIAAPLVELVGGGCVGAHGLPLIDTEVGQLPRIGNSAFRMQAVSGPPQRAATLFIGLGLGDLPIGPCNFRGLPELFNIPTTTSADGMASVAVPIPGDPVLVGGAVTFQWVILDPTGGLFGLASLSDGMFAVIGV